MTDVSRRHGRDREASAHGLTMQVLANQVNELSGLVRQVLEGGRRRRRSRSDSRRRSRSRRGRSTRSVPPPRTPSEPPRRSPTPSPRTSTPLTPYPEDQRQDLEQLLFQQLHGRDGNPLCWNPDEGLLTLLVESVRFGPIGIGRCGFVIRPWTQGINRRTGFGSTSGSGLMSGTPESMEVATSRRRGG